MPPPATCRAARTCRPGARCRSILGARPRQTRTRSRPTARRRGECRAPSMSSTTRASTAGSSTPSSSGANLDDIVTRLLAQAPRSPRPAGRASPAGRAPTCAARVRPLAARPERFVRAKALDQGQDDLLHGLAQRGSGTSAGRGRPPDLTDRERSRPQPRCAATDRSRTAATSWFQMSWSRQCDAKRPEHENSTPSGSSSATPYRARTSGRTSCVTSTPSRGCRR